LDLQRAAELVRCPLQRDAADVAEADWLELAEIVAAASGSVYSNLKSNAGTALPAKNAPSSGWAVAAGGFPFGAVTT